MYCQREGSAFDWGGAGYALEAITCMVYVQFTHAFYNNSFTFSSRHNVMFAAKHSLHTDDSSPYMICTNQEDSVISDWGGALT